jgi:hypothetical protein
VQKIKNLIKPPTSTVVVALEALNPTTNTQFDLLHHKYYRHGVQALISSLPCAVSFIESHISSNQEVIVRHSRPYPSIRRQQPNSSRKYYIKNAPRKTGAVMPQRRLYTCNLLPASKQHALPAHIHPSTFLPIQTPTSCSGPPGCIRSPEDLLLLRRTSNRRCFPSDEECSNSDLDRGTRSTKSK